MATSRCFSLRGSVKEMEGDLKSGLVLANWGNRLDWHGGTLATVYPMETPVPEGLRPEMLPGPTDLDDYLTGTSWTIGRLDTDLP
jgi:hypothetical protein